MSQANSDSSRRLPPGGGYSKNYSYEREDIVAVPVQQDLQKDYQRILKNSKPVKQLIQALARRENFSLGALKRTVYKIWRERNGSSRDTTPDYTDPKDMFDKRLFIPGRSAVECNLKPGNMKPLHLLHCSLCRPYGNVRAECYFSCMLRCVENGWNPPIDRHQIKSIYKCDNSPRIKAYSLQTIPEMEEMVRHEVVKVADGLTGLVINPLGVVIKSSDIQRARTLVQMEVKDAITLKRASEALVMAGYPKIKCRISTDCTGSGINGAAYSPAFQYSTVSDGLKVVIKDGYLSTGDVSRYFFEFPWAESVRPLFCFLFFGQLYQYLRLCFGFTSCPYFCSTWSAEFYQWFKAMGIEASFLMDDWLVGGKNESEAKRKMDKISDTLTSVGFTMAKEKNKLGQRLTWLGLFIDTTTMSIRIDPIQAEGFLAQLRVYEVQILCKRSIDLSTLRHISGKLNWYAEVISSGRLHIRSLWDYAKTYPSISDQGINKLLQDLRWWQSKLATWSQNVATNAEYKILNGAEILRRPESIILCQSDASGTDGFGYAWSTLKEEGFNWYSARWDATNIPRHSHEAELRSFQDFIVHRLNRDVPPSLIIWITDSESACWTMNRGHCADPLAWPILEEIFATCDHLGSQIVALWVPREENTFADYLSHFAYLMNRDDVQGRQDEGINGFLANSPR